MAFFRFTVDVLKLGSDLYFAHEYRNVFVEFSNKYFKGYKPVGLGYMGDIDPVQRQWLTKNADKAQGELGTFGIITYITPFDRKEILNYQVVLNTIPKFRDGSVTQEDVLFVDDCLLRYIGCLEDRDKVIQKYSKNPIVWFREGFREILSIPIFIVNWFGIISNQTARLIKDSAVYGIISGFIAFLAAVGSIITIVLGYGPMIQLVKKLLGN